MSNVLQYKVVNRAGIYGSGSNRTFRKGHKMPTLLINRHLFFSVSSSYYAIFAFANANTYRVKSDGFVSGCTELHLSCCTFLAVSIFGSANFKFHLKEVLAQNLINSMVICF